METGAGRTGPENVLYATTPGFTLMFKGKLKLRDVSFHYTLSR